MESPYDFSKSNLVLLAGGKILFLIVLIFIFLCETPPVSFPANAVKKMLSSNVQTKIN
uniref:Uncharacterized protein n=1 Tax=viral metagenome TaxID=1070528 RepID=A0A6C0KL90_9ZZZZ